MSPGALLEQLQHRYDVCMKPICIGRWTELSVLTVRDPDALLDKIDPAVFEREERLPYWAEVWPAAIGLGLHLFEHPIQTARPVLELGCGVGVAGLAAAQVGLQVLATDYEPDALDFARYNAMLNGTTDRMTFRYLDWRRPDLMERFPVIIGSDIVYDRSDHPPLLDLLDRVLERGGTFLLSDPQRSPAETFVEAMAQRGYCYTGQTRRVRMDGPGVRVTVYRFRKDW